MKAKLHLVPDGLPQAILDSHERVCIELEGMVKCIRNFELGDFSPLMDEIFDSENALKLAKPYRK